MDNCKAVKKCFIIQELLHAGGLLIHDFSFVLATFNNKANNIYQSLNILTNNIQELIYILLLL